MMNIKNSNPNVGYKDVDIKIRYFQIHWIPQSCKCEKHLDYNWKKVKRKNKIDYHPLIDSPKKKKKTH